MLDSTATGSVLRGGLGVADWAVVAVYGLAMLAIGLYYSYRHKTSEDYYLGGRRMSPFMVGLSLFATMISTISYLAVPGEIMKHGPIYLTSIAALPFIYLSVGYFLVPYIMRLPITSAYEILELRFGKPVRLLGSCIFLMIRFVWMGLVIYTCAKVVVKASGLDDAWTPYVSGVVGVVTVVYASIGGLQAVVLTDVIQAFILFGGAIVTILVITVKMGGVGWFPTHWAPNWDTQPLFSFNPEVRVTVFGTILSTTVWWVCTAGSDQMAIQRYLSTRNAQAARRAFLINNTAEALITLLLALLGFALLGFFTANPQFLSAHLNLRENTDLIFPHFIVNFIGYGIAGLVISGMLAAAMSSLSSGINATCTVLNTDVFPYFVTRELSEHHKIRAARLTSFVIGGIVTAFSLLVGNVPGNLIEMTSKTSNLFVGPLFGLFFFAMFVPFATPLGAVFGSLYGLLAAFLFSFWDVAGGASLSWQWILPAAVVADIAAGTLVSLIPMQGRSTRFKIALSAALALPFVVAMSLFLAAM